MTRKSVLPHEPGQGQGQGQMASVDLLMDTLNSLPDETPFLARHGDELSDLPCLTPASSQGKIELQSKLALPTPPTIVWRRLMLEQ